MCMSEPYPLCVAFIQFGYLVVKFERLVLMSYQRYYQREIQKQGENQLKYSQAKDSQSCDLARYITAILESIWLTQWLSTALVYCVLTTLASSTHISRRTSDGCTSAKTG